MSTNTIIFSGPTISNDQASSILDGLNLGPVSQGDLYSSFEKYHPQYVGIIDGYFEKVPSVWHKEILFLMSKGVHVFGSSSMGALRASELHTFGMIGVGKIFDSYQNGKLEDDDEVAIVHGPKELGYPILSEAMVNIRQTASDALAQSIISPQFSLSLLREAKAIYYKERTYFRILEKCKASSRYDADIQKFLDWLPYGRRDLKKEDAILMLHVMDDFKNNVSTPKTVYYNFEHTVFWADGILGHK